MISHKNTAQLDNPSRRLDLENLDKFVKITEAARLLDYASVISVKKLVDDGMLTLYSLPKHPVLGFFLVNFWSLNPSKLVYENYLL